MKSTPALKLQIYETEHEPISTITHASSHTPLKNNYRRMKKTLLLPILFTILLSISVVSCDDPPKPARPGDVTDITLNKEAVTLKAGYAETLTATIAPDNATDKTIRWYSDRPEVATVDESTGEINAISEGVAKITATTHNNKRALCNVTVIPGPIKISTAGELAAIATTEGLAKEYILMNDITVSNWLPIGTQTIDIFTGKLDGNNHTITINSFRDIGTTSSNYYFGLFNFMDKGSEVRNLKMVINQSITKNDGNVYFGGITGHLNGGIIDNCATNISLNISGLSGCIGGIAGRVKGESIIRNCYTIGEINVFSGSNSNAGGIAGDIAGANSIIQNCHTTNNIKISMIPDPLNPAPASYAGGIVGYMNSGIIIQNCYTIGNIDASYAGGIVGLAIGTIQNCVALSNNITAPNRYRIGQKLNPLVVFMNNYGSTATTAMPAKTWISNANGEDGANCAARPTESWWKDSSNWLIDSGCSAWDFTNIWQWDSMSGLPKLRDIP